MPKRELRTTTTSSTEKITGDVKPSIHRIMINEPTFGLFAEVIAAISRRDGKFRTQKQVLVEGLDIIIRSAVFERFLWLKTYDRSRHRGDRAFFFQFDGNEKRLVQETRALLEQDSGAKITTHDALILALLAVARRSGSLPPRQEAKKIGGMDIGTIPIHK